MSYPYPVREVVADGVIHALGLSAGITGVVFLIFFAAQNAEASVVVALAIYAGFLLFALSASAAYHMLPWERPRDWLHRIDHAAIYFKIAGTYTPIVVVIGSFFGYAVLAGIWGLALGGAIAKLSFWRPGGRGSLALYLGMGWGCLLLLPLMIQTLPGHSLILIVIGGGLYTLGTVFFCWRALPYQNAIWHAFVLAASSCFFASIAMALEAAPV